MIYAGIDAGSRTIKVVLLRGEGLHIVASGVADQGIKQMALAAKLLESVLKKGGISRRILLPESRKRLHRGLPPWPAVTSPNRLFSRAA